MSTPTETTKPVRYIHLSRGGMVAVGGLAGMDTPHGFLGDRFNGSSCQACFGWYDDPRHILERYR